MAKEVLTDQSIIKFGVHRGKALANVPASYLLYLHGLEKVSPSLKDYIEDNYVPLEAQKKLEDAAYIQQRKHNSR